MNSSAAVAVVRNRWNRLADLLGPQDMQVLRRMAEKLAGKTMDADDLLQDALERACHGVDRFEAGSNLHAWMRTIMQRLVIDEWRKRGRRQFVPIDRLASPAPDADDDQPPPAWTRHGIEEVRRAVAELREPLRTTFQLYSLRGLSYAAISARQGIPVATVGTRLRRARGRVRRILERSAGAQVIDIGSFFVKGRA